MPLILDHGGVHYRSPRRRNGAAANTIDNLGCLLSQPGPNHEQNKPYDETYNRYNDYNHEFM